MRSARRFGVIGIAAAVLLTPCATRSRRLPRSSYTPGAWQRDGASRYGLEWTVDVPSIGKRFRIEALTRRDFNPNRVIVYWEGLRRVYDKQGKVAGHAVEETTASAHPLSGRGAR